MCAAAPPAFEPSAHPTMRRGADVFVWGSERRAKLGERFKAWLPTAPLPGPMAKPAGPLAERG